MRIALRAALAAGITLVIFGSGAAPAEFDDSPPGFWEVDETDDPGPNPDDGATPVPDEPASRQDTDAEPGVEPEWPDDETDEAWGDEEWDDEDFDGEEWDESDWGDDSDGGCHGILSCSFSLVGQAIALPFRIIGGVFRVVF